MDRKSATISACHAPFLLVMLEFCGHILGPVIFQIERRFLFMHDSSPNCGSIGVTNKYWFYYSCHYSNHTTPLTTATNNYYLRWTLLQDKNSPTILLLVLVISILLIRSHTSCRYRRKLVTHSRRSKFSQVSNT
jgi:hypothetical protein